MKNIIWWLSIVDLQFELRRAIDALNMYKENMLTSNANKKKIKNNIFHVINIRLR